MIKPQPTPKPQPRGSLALRHVPEPKPFVREKIKTQDRSYQFDYKQFNKDTNK